MNVAPDPGTLESSRRPPCARAIACTIERPRPAPSRASLSAGPCRSGRRRAPAPRRDPRARVPDPEPRVAVAHEGAEADLVALLGVLNGVLGELHQRLGQRWRSATIIASATASSRQLRGPIAEAFASTSSIERADLERSRLQEVGLLPLRQGQEVVDDPAHPVELVHDERQRLRRAPAGRPQAARDGRARS